jgi:hypothetical protein
MSPDLRPLTLGELLDRAFSLYRRHFWLFVGIMAVPSLLALAVGVVFALFSSPGSPEAPTPDVNMAEVIGAALWMGGALIVLGSVYFTTYAVALGATTVAVSHIYMDRPASIRGAFAPLRGKVGRLALLLLLVSIRLFAVFVLGFAAMGGLGAVAAMASPVLAAILILPGIVGVFGACAWVALRYAVAVPVAVLEDETSTDAIRRSIDLTKGSRGRVFALFAFATVITYAVLLVFQGPFMFLGFLAGPETRGFFWTNLLGTISGSIGGAFTAPLMIVAFAVLYYDLRVRKEGLDVELMLAGLDQRDHRESSSSSSALLPG